MYQLPHLGFNISITSESSPVLSSSQFPLPVGTHCSDVLIPIVIDYFPLF